MKLFTVAQLTFTLALVSGVTQAMPLSIDVTAASTALANREIFGREPQLFYGRQDQQDIVERGFFTNMLGKAVNRVATKVVDKVGGSKAGSIKKGINVATGLFGMIGI